MLGYEIFIRFLIPFMITIVKESMKRIKMLFSLKGQVD